MKILICSTLYPSLGGIPNHSEELAKQFLQLGHDVSIIGKKESNYPKSFEILKKIKIHRYDRKESLREEVKEIEKRMFQIKEKFDLIIVLWYKFFRPAYNVFPDSKIVYILPSVRSIAMRVINKDNSFWKKIYYWFKNRFMINLEKEAVREADLTVYLGENMQKQVEEEYNFFKGKIIHLGVDHNKFKPARAKRKDIALIVANLDPRKGIDRAIKVSKLLKNIEIWVVGGGKRKKAYEKLIGESGNNKIRFLGFKKNVPYYLNKSFVYLMTSYSEGFPHVLLESMASGLPVIAFKPDRKTVFNNSDEIIKDGKTGFLVKSEKEMAEKINFLYKNKRLWQTMSKQALQYSKDFSWERHVAELLDSIKPKVSVIMAVHNNEKYLKSAINSVLNQTFKNFELLYIDDSSNDSSLKIARDVAGKDKRIRIFSIKKRGGQFKAFNKFLNQIRGDYVILFDGDDLLHKRRLEEQVKFMEKSNLEFSYCDTLLLFEDGKIEKRESVEYTKNSRKILIGKAKEEFDLKMRPGFHLSPRGNSSVKTVFGGTFMIKADSLKKLKLNDKIKRLADHDLWFQAIGKNMRIKRFPKHYWIYRQHENQKSKDKKKGDAASRYINRKLKSGAYFK